MSRKVIITDDVHPFLKEGLKQMDFEYDYDPEISQAELQKIISKYTGLIINSRILVNRELLEAAKNLEFVGRLGSGMEIIDLPFAEECGVACFSAPEGNRNAVAEHALGGILSLFNKINRGDREVRQKIWDREGNRGEELEGKTLGIIGYGNTGTAFARILRGMDIRVLAYDKYKSGYTENNVEETDMDEIFKHADILSLHLPLTQETKWLVNKKYLENFKKPFYIINTSRGKIVQTRHILDGLESGRLRGAVLDVFENENIPDLPEADKEWFGRLVKMENVVLTPHVAGWTHQSKQKISRVLIEKINKFYQQKDL